MDNSKEKGVTYIFTAYITRPDGRRIYAKQYGKKAFCIPVTSAKPSN